MMAGIMVRIAEATVRAPGGSNGEDPWWVSWQGREPRGPREGIGCDNPDDPDISFPRLQRPPAGSAVRVDRLILNN